MAGQVGPPQRGLELLQDDTQQGYDVDHDRPRGNGRFPDRVEESPCILFQLGGGLVQCGKSALFRPGLDATCEEVAEGLVRVGPLFEVAGRNC